MARYIDMDKLSEMIEARAEQLIEGKDAFLYVAKWLNLLPEADVVPRAEVANEIIFDLACKLHTMLPHKIHPILIDGKCEGNTYELGKEHVIYDTLKYLNELEKKYAEGK